MKVVLVLVCLSVLGCAQDAANSPGDSRATSVAEAARKSRENKPATAKKVYTNDDLPAGGGGVSVVGNQAEAEPSPYRSASDPVREQKTVDNQWRARIDQQKGQVANLEQQLQTAQENLARVTHFYGVNPNPRYARYKDQVESLKQQVESAKKQLTELQDEAHKAGANKAYD